MTGFFMNKRNKIFFNYKLFKKFADKSLFNEFAFFYMLKILISNSIIYDFKINTLHAKLRALGLIGGKFSQSKLKRYIDTLISEGLAKKSGNHLILISVHKNKIYYISKIEFSGPKTFDEIKELLLLEEIRYNNYNQKKVLEFREKITNQIHKNGKKKVNKSKLDCFLALEESYYSKPLITYRTLADTINLSLSETYNLAKNLIKNGLLQLKTIVINHKTFVACDLNLIKDIFNIKSYCYLYNGFLYSIVGSEIKYC